MGRQASPPACRSCTFRATQRKPACTIVYTGVYLYRHFARTWSPCPDDRVHFPHAPRERNEMEMSPRTSGNPPAALASRRPIDPGGPRTIFAITNSTALPTALVPTLTTTVTTTTPTNFF